MPKILLLSGSPTTGSKSRSILQYVAEVLQAKDFQTTVRSVRDFDPTALLYGQAGDSKIAAFIHELYQADALVLATPIYKGTYTGALKTLLDLLPQYALREKTVLPIATGGSIAHLLAMDYGIKPLLSILGSSAILPGIFVTDEQYRTTDGDRFLLDDAVQQRLDQAIENLAGRIAYGTMVNPEIEQ